MGFRRRTRRRALIAGAAIGRHNANQNAGAQQDYEEAPPADDYQEAPQPVPPPADPYDQIEHLAQLHASGALTDDEFATAKAKILGS
jgi:hypothetical protein